MNLHTGVLVELQISKISQRFSNQNILLPEGLIKFRHLRTKFLHFLGFPKQHLKSFYKIFQNQSLMKTEHAWFKLRLPKVDQSPNELLKIPLQGPQLL